MPGTTGSSGSSPSGGYGSQRGSDALAEAQRKKTMRRGFFAIATLGALVFAAVWNPPISSQHSFTKASDYRMERESGCTNSGKGCHGSESAYTDFNAYHPNAKCTTCHDYQGVGCIPCHAPSEHECQVCHDGTMQAAPDRVKLTDPYPRGHYRETTHTAMGTDYKQAVRGAISGEASARCKDCHSRDLGAAHTGVPEVAKSEYGADIGCGECHSDTRAYGQVQVLNDWESRECEACHKPKSSAPMHRADVATPVRAKDPQGCADTGAGCHDSLNLHKLHADAPRNCSGAAKKGEPGCHDLKQEAHLPAAKTCGGRTNTACHKGYGVDGFTHLKDRDLHAPTSTVPAADTAFYSTACGDCHDIQTNGTSLVDEHALPTSSKTTEPGDNCRNCHNDPASSAAIAAGWENRNTTSACEDCHGAEGLPAAHEGDLESLHSPAGSDGCASTGWGCHPTNNLIEVGAPTTDANLHRDCLRCHDRTASDGNIAYDPTRRTCGSGRDCHQASGQYNPDTAVHAGGSTVNGTDAKHTVTAALTGRVLVDQASGVSATCGDCHGARLGTEHARTSSAIASGSGTACQRCHSRSASTGAVVKASWPTRTGSNACAACHGTSGVNVLHHEIDVSHLGSELTTTGAYQPGTCAKAGCHSTADLRKLHKTDGCVTSGCHQATGDIMGLGITSCGGTNPERSCHVGIHSATTGNDPENHLAGAAQESATYNEPVSGLSVPCKTCHQMYLGMEHQRVNSALSTASAGLCAGCHDHNATTKNVVATQWPTRDSDEACTACHGHEDLPEPHGRADSVHTASEVATNDVETAGSCVVSGCHQSTDVRRLHRAVGCAIEGCHQSTGDIAGKRIMRCGGTDAATGCHVGFSAANHNQDHSIDLTGTVNGVDYSVGANIGCVGCHQRDLRLEHSLALKAGSMEGGGSSNCHVCHAQNDDPNAGAFSGLSAVKTAIATHDRRCIACHNSGTASDGPTATASPHKVIATDTITQPVGSVWADPFDDWKAAFASESGGGHNALPGTAVGSASTKEFPVTTATVGGTEYVWALAPNTSTTLWLQPSVYPTSSVNSTESIQHLRVTCSDCHTLPADMAGPQGAAVKIQIDPDYAQTEWANPTPGTYQFNTHSGPVAPPSVGATNPAGYKPVICFKCHSVFYGGAPSLTATQVGGNSLHRTHASRANIYCTSCHLRIPHAWKRPRLLVNTADTTSAAGPDMAPYIQLSGSFVNTLTGEFKGLQGMKLRSYVTPAQVSRDNCATGGCYTGSATTTNHPVPAKGQTTGWSYW